MNTDTFFSAGLYISLAVFGVGLLYKVFTWFRNDVAGTSQTTGQRVGAFIKGFFATIFSPRIGGLLKSFILDGLLQLRVLRDSPTRWVMHMCIYAGFMLLLLMHAMDSIITSKIFSDYASTLNPFMFLRNLFGALVIIGVIIALVRRSKMKVLRRISVGMDRYAIIILAVIMLSGVGLEAVKILSESRFNYMVENYAALDDEEVLPLKAYWAKEFDVVFSEPVPVDDEMMVEQGKGEHDISCAYCHSKPTSAFMSYAVAQAIKPAAPGISSQSVERGLWYLHILACFLGLAYLPFSKFIHIFTGPLSLMANEVMDPKTSDPANWATKQALELDACMHCGTCSSRCSVGISFEDIPNMAIYPSEKLALLRKFTKGKDLSPSELSLLREGNSICTRCMRCTDVCPVGINLQDLWLKLKEKLDRKGYPEAFSFARNAVEAEQRAKPAEEEIRFVPGGDGFEKNFNLSTQAHTFSQCFTCQTCTNVCPVVASYENPQEELGLLPHQIMHSLRFGLREKTASCGMTWQCVTCYMCQEHCPQGVKVTDILYELRNMGYSHVTKNGTGAQASV